MIKNIEKREEELKEYRKSYYQRIKEKEKNIKEV